MADVGLVIEYGTEVDLTGIHKGIAEVQKAVEQKPVSFNIKSLGDMSTQLGDAKAFFKEMENGSVNVEKVTVQYAKFRDKLTGDVFRIPVSGLREVRDATGKVVVETEEWNKAIVKANKANKDLDYVGKSTATSNMGTATRKAAADLNAMAKELDNNVKSADRFLAKSKNMSGQQVEDAKKVANALKAEKAEFDKLFGAPNKDWDAIGKKGEKVRQLAIELDRVKQSTNAGANAFQNWGERIGNAIKQTVSYALSIKMVQEAQRLFNQAVQYAIELNTEMTKIQVLQTEGAKTTAQINALADSFNRLGQQMGVSTLEVARGSVEWLRQGRTIEETQKLLVSSLQLAKLGAMDSADATNYLTSITNAFGISAEQASTVVDKLIAVDNIAATSAGELATALRYTSESAAIAGVSMEQLVSYIGTVSTVTRQNAEMIGQAFKTMFARMTQIQGGGLDETGQSISKVEAALAKVNIQIRNADGEWLGMGDVLEQTAAKWDTLTTREQTEIATAVAGVRQKEAFLVLMNNMDKALTYQAAQVNSLGLANERYGIYLESVQAKQGKLKAQMEELFSKTLNSNTVKTVLDLANAFVEFVNAIGGLPPIIGVLTGLFIIFRTVALMGVIKDLAATGVSLTSLILSLAGFDVAANAAAVSTYSLSGALTVLMVKLSGAAAADVATATANYTLATSFKALLASIPVIGWAIAAVGVIIGVVSGIIAYNNHKLAEQKKAYEDAKQSVDEYLQKVQQIPSQMKQVNDAVTELNLLWDAQAKSGKLSNDQLDQQNQLFQQLYQILPNLPWKFADGSPYIDKSTLATIDLRKALEELYAVQSPGIKAFMTDMQGQVKAYEDTKAAAEKSAKTQELLTLLQTKGVKDYSDGLRILGEVDTTGWTKSEMQALQDAKDFMNKNTNLLGDLRQGFSTTLSTAIIQATQDTASNQATQKGMKDSLTQLISMSLGKQDATSKAFMEQIRTLASQGEGVVRDALAEAEGAYKDSKDRVVYSERDLLRMRAAHRGETKKVVLSEKELEAAYTKEAAGIKKLSPAFKNLNDVLGDSKATNSQLVDAVLEVNNQLGELANTTPGLVLQIKTLDDLQNAAGTALDPAKVEAYRQELINWLITNSALKGTNDVLYNSIVEQLNALGPAAASVANTVLNINGQMFSMSATQFQNFSNFAGQVMFDQAQRDQIVLRDLAGNVIVSGEDIARALAQDAANYAYFIQQLSASTSGLINSTLAALGQAASFYTGASPVMPTNPFSGGGGGGGGGGNPNQAQIDALDEEIKKLEEDKKAWQDKLKQYKEYIALQKQSLQRQKEEADFQDELSKKHKDLGKVKARLAVLALDNSEQAMKEREELEAEAAEKEEDITKTVEDRKYDLQIQALDDMEKAFEDFIQAQIDGIDKVIDELNKQKDALSDTANGGGGGGGGGGSWGGLTGAVNNFSVEAMKVFDQVHARFGEFLDDIGVSDAELLTWAQNWLVLKGNAEDAARSLENAIRLQQQLYASNGGRNAPVTDQYGMPVGIKDPYTGKYKTYAIHSGGIVESHHEGGDFAGNLMANEVFAKLLKGEYVATEGQMSNFLKNILPKVAGRMAPMVQGPGGGGSKQQQVGNITIDVDINVAGSLDKNVVPSIEKGFMKVVNKALEVKGIRRTAGNFTI